MWHALSSTLAVGERLQTRGINADPSCKSGGHASESICHVLFHCPMAADVWRASRTKTYDSDFSHNSMFLNLHFLVTDKRKQSTGEDANYFTWIIWSLES